MKTTGKQNSKNQAGKNQAGQKVVSTKKKQPLDLSPKQPGKKVNTSRFSAKEPNQSNTPKEMAIPHKMSFFNVPKNPNRFKNKKKI